MINPPKHLSEKQTQNTRSNKKKTPQTATYVTNNNRKEIKIPEKVERSKECKDRHHLTPIPGFSNSTDILTHKLNKVLKVSFHSNSSLNYKKLDFEVVSL